MAQNAKILKNAEKKKKKSKLDTLSQNFDDLPHINLIPGE